MTEANKKEMKEWLGALDTRIYNDSLRMERMKEQIKKLKKQLKLMKETA